MHQRFWEFDVFNTACGQVNSLLLGIHHYHCRLGSAGTIVGILGVNLDVGNLNDCRHSGGNQNRP